MMKKSANTTAEKITSLRKEYIEAFADVVTAFAPAQGEDILAQIPGMLVARFGAARAELWLWDEATDSAYMVHHAGQGGGRRQEFIAAGKGAIGKAGQSQKLVESIALSTFGAEEQEFSRRTRLSHISCYPLTDGGRSLAVVAVYSACEVPRERMQWWRMYAEICGIKLPNVIAKQERQREVTQFSLLFEATRLLNSTLDLAELLELILKIGRDELKADRGSVFLLDNASHELWSIVASGLDKKEIRIPFGAGVAGHVAQTGETVNVEDAYQLSYFEPGFDQKFNYKTKSLLCMPVRRESGEIAGVIQLLNKSTAPAFTREDEKFIEKLGGHMATALENARRYREAFFQQHMNQELEQLRNMKRSLLPEAVPSAASCEIAVGHQQGPAVGGGYYDFLKLGPHSLLLVMAEVGDKGIGAVLKMNNLRTMLRALVMHLHSLEALAVSLNELICDDKAFETPLGLFMGLVDTRRSGLHYINAGHVPPLLINGDSGQVRRLEDGGTALGLFPHGDYIRGAMSLKAGDVLVCVSDGILHASNASGEGFGEERLAGCAQRDRGKSAQEIAVAVGEEVRAFAISREPEADRLVMVVKVVGSAAAGKGASS